MQEMTESILARQALTISVITVCRNARPTIETTVQSVLWQNYRACEYVVVDGMSDDGTWDLLQRYRDRIAVMVHEPDAGIYDAMNKGLRLSHGDVVVFMNANDYFISPFVLARVAEAFEQHPDVDIIYGDFIADDGVQQRAYRQATRIDRRHFLMNRNLLHQSMFCRRRAYERIGGFDETYPITADRDWNVRAFVVAGLRYLHLPVVICVFDRHGLSNTATGRSILEIRAIIDRYYSRPARLFWRARLRWLSVRDRALWRLRHRDLRPPRLLRELWQRPGG